MAKKRNVGQQRSIVHDRWDRQDLAVARDGVPGFRRARKKINDAADTGTEAVDDMFYVLFKADPHQVSASEMSASYLVNHRVIAELMGLSAVNRLRDQTVGDVVLAGLACVDLAPTLEAIFEKVALTRQRLVALEALRQQLAEWAQTIDRLTDALDSALDNETDGVSGDAKEAANDLKTARLFQEATAAAERSAARELDQILDDLAPEIRSALSDALGDASDRAAATLLTARAWGSAPGELRRLPVAERMALARELNDERLRAVAELFGRIENLALSTSTEEVDGFFEEVADLELGDDLGRVVGAELLLLGHPDTELDFLARLSDRELLQYQVHGTDELGRGGIVYCLDGSLSMHGRREIFGKALMLFLLHQARRQGRQMHVIHFGYRQHLTFSFTRPADFTAERIMEAGQAFWGSGTDFETPLDEALVLLGAEHDATGRVRSDIVFVSDDEYAMNPRYLQSFLKRLAEIGGRCWGVLVDELDPQPTGALAQISEGRVVSAKDVRSGRDLRSVLAGVR